MFQIIGIICVFVLVFGGFVWAGGHFDVILHSAPYEMTMIGGAALGAFLIGNTPAVVARTAGDFARIFTGTKWKAQDYKDLLSLLFLLTKMMKTKV